MFQRHRSTILWCVGFFCVGLIARLIYVRESGIPVQEHSDMLEYITLARNLSQGLGFTYDGTAPYTFRPPLFSALLGLWCFLAGSTSMQTMVGFQVFVQTLCAPLTYLLVRQAQRSERLALGAGWFVALYPFIFTSVTMVMQEPTQMLVATLIGMAVVAWGRQPTLWRAALVGVAFGLGGLAKSPFLFGPVLIVGLFVVARSFRRQFPFQQVALVCVAAGLVILPWTIRNYEVSGRFIPVNSQDSAFSMWIVADGNYIVREAASDPLPDVPVRQSGILLTYGNADGVAYLQKKNDELIKDGVKQPAISKALSKASLSYMAAHPIYVLVTTIRGMVLIFSPDASVALTQALKTRLVAMILFHLPLALGLLVGVFGTLRRQPPAVTILSLFTAAYLLIHAPVAGAGGRYCVPVLPLLIAITGCLIFGERAPHHARVRVEV